MFGCWSWLGVNTLFNCRWMSFCVNSLSSIAVGIISANKTVPTMLPTTTFMEFATTTIHCNTPSCTHLGLAQWDFEGYDTRFVWGHKSNDSHAIFPSPRRRHRSQCAARANFDLRSSVVGRAPLKVQNRTPGLIKFVLIWMMVLRSLNVVFH